MASQPCAVCFRPISVTSAGLIRQHGPFHSRCPGSRNPPGGAVPSGPLAQQPQPTSPNGGPTTTTPTVTQANAPQSRPQPSISGPSCPPVKIIRRIPKASRAPAGRKLINILETIVNTNAPAAWDRLLHLGTRCFRAPPRGGQRWSLATSINRQLSEESDPLPVNQRPWHPSHNPLSHLAARVSTKLEEGDFRGAVRLACSDDTLTDKSDSTYTALQQKHPPPHPDTSIPPCPDNLPNPISVSEDDIAQAIRSFPSGSAGGPDGLRPQHLKDMIAGHSGVGRTLLSVLASFITMVLAGKTPLLIRPLFFGATLVALRKKEGGIRPIAVGCTLRRLAAKVIGEKLWDDMCNLLAPAQLGYGTKRGAEAAVHASRVYLHNLEPDHLLLKLDFKNAFNSIRRDKMLEATLALAPDLFPFAHSVYSSPSSLYWGDRIIQSAEGVQQGDPLGPLLFCLTIHKIISQLHSELRIAYLDDVTLGGCTSDVSQDVEMVQHCSDELGLQLSHQKSEILCDDISTRDKILSVLPGSKVVGTACATLLGSSLGDVF